MSRDECTCIANCHLNSLTIIIIVFLNIPRFTVYLHLYILCTASTGTTRMLLVQLHVQSCNCLARFSTNCFLLLAMATKF